MRPLRDINAASLAWKRIRTHETGLTAMRFNALVCAMDTAAVPETAITKRRGRGDTQHPGIVRHARLLGVTYAHLYRVLIGERKSPGLLRRYDALLASEGRTRTRA